MIGLRYVSIVLILLLLVPLTAARIYCTVSEPYDPDNPNCVYDVPGGEELIGPGKEILENNEQDIADDHLSVMRWVSVVRTGTVSYRMPGVAELYTETIVSFDITNEGEETATDMEITQPINGIRSYSIYVGDVESGENKVVSFTIAGEYVDDDLGEPEVKYNLPQVDIEITEAVVGEKVEVLLSINSVPVEGELVEVISPTGLSFNLRTNEEGKIDKI